MGYMRFRTNNGMSLSSGTVNQYYMGLNQLLIYVWEKYKEPSGEQLWKGLEIGAYMGESTHMFLSSGLFRGGFTVIDPWEGPIKGLQSKGDIEQFSWDNIKRDFENNVEMFYDRNWCDVSVIRGWSQNAHTLIDDESLDFIYIDGDHTYMGVKEDIQNYLPKLKKGGLMAGHDYEVGTWSGVVDAVDHTIGKPEKVFMDSSWIKQIN
jgi:hypothetical protein